MLIVCGIFTKWMDGLSRRSRESFWARRKSASGTRTVRASTDRLRMLTPPQIRFPSAPQVSASEQFLGRGAVGKNGVENLLNRPGTERVLGVGEHRGIALRICAKATFRLG